MTRLLKATFFRLIKNKVFWGIVIITIILACFLLFNDILNRGDETNKGIDRILLMYINFIGFFIALFTSLFVGTEYSDGSIRNKIIIGHSRKTIYLANVMTSVWVGILIEMVYMVSVTSIGIPTLGVLQMSMEKFLFIIIDILFIIVSYSSIFTCITLLCSDITVSTVACTILMLVMFVASMALDSTANTTQYYETYETQENGKVEVYREPNPNYPGDLKKTLAKNILYCIPTGQAYEIVSQLGRQPFQMVDYMSDDEIKIASLYSLGVTIVVNLFGIYCFKRKDLK